MKLTNKDLRDRLETIYNALCAAKLRDINLQAHPQIAHTKELLQELIGEIHVEN